MDFADYATGAVHVVPALAGVLLAAHLGRLLTRMMRQPGVIAEVAVGLLAGPVILAIGGNGALPYCHQSCLTRCRWSANWDWCCSSSAWPTICVRSGSQWTDTDRIVLGALLLSLVGGVAFTAWVLTGDLSRRSSKPAIPLVLLLAPELSVTAVPVLARLLADVGLLDSEVGKLAMVTAVATDAGAWVLVALAVRLTAGSWSSPLVLVAATVITVVSALLALRLLRTESADRFPARFPRSTTELIAAMALVAAVLTKRTGLTEVCGALAVGFALSAKPQWERSWARHLTWAGSWFRSPSWPPASPCSPAVCGRSLWVTVLTVFATAGVAGSYLGARAAGKAPELSLRLGVLLNTRGLTELVVLQAGTAPKFSPRRCSLVYGLIARYTARAGPMRQRRITPC